MKAALAEQLSEELSKIDRPGSFSVSGHVPAVLPGLEVAGVGPIALPLTPRQANVLKKHCQQAPYGKGEETIVDTKVRRVWRLELNQFKLTNPDWESFLKQTVKSVQEGLGLEKQKLEAHLYDLLLYEKGSFFRPHRDGEKLDRMVATLVLVLPSSFEGGELIVRHDGQEQSIDFGGGGDASQFRIHYAAFYADCEHEVRPLRKGYRLCLVYNLTLAKSKKRIAPRKDSEIIEKVSQVLNEWSVDESARKLVITLDHQYTQDGLTWDALKGVDRVKARVLHEAARRAGCKAYLALLTFWESGSAVDDGSGYGYGSGGYRRRGRWYDEYEEEDEDEDEDEGEEDEDEGGRYEMEDVIESSLTAKHWSDAEGNGLPLAELDVEEEELLDPDALRDVKPEEDFEGYTGNAGMTLDRWYRHAAIILWPEKQHFAVLCDEGGRRVVPVLEDLVAQWRRARQVEAPALKAQCVTLARMVIANWGENKYSSGAGGDSDQSGLLKPLMALNDPGLIGAFLGEVMLKDVAVEPGPSLVTICQEHGWRAFQPELTAVVKSTTAGTLERSIRLLEQVCSADARKKEGWAELCATLAGEMVVALETIDGDTGTPQWGYRSPHRVEVLVGLTRALLAGGQADLLGRVVDHVLATPGLYPLESVLLPALTELQPWLKKHVKGPSPALSKWLTACRAQLEALTKEAPTEPRDLRRAAPITCKCAACTALNRFLDDPRQATHRYTAGQADREHVEQHISGFKCDLVCKTEKQGRPYTLVCTKNSASYKEQLRTYHQNQERLATVRAIQASLPPDASA